MEDYTRHEDAECGIDVQRPRLFPAEMDDDGGDDNNDGSQRISKDVKVDTLHVKVTLTFVVATSIFSFLFGIMRCVFNNCFVVVVVVVFIQLRVVFGYEQRFHIHGPFLKSSQGRGVWGTLVFR